MTDDINVWDIEEIPNFTGMNIFVLSGAFHRECVQLFRKSDFTIVDEIEKADVVAFIGGVDVDPALYGEKAISFTQRPDLVRDAIEIEAYEHCIAEKKPMFGICRGAQFLHVMNKGTLWQHVEGHVNGPHWIYDTEDNCLVKATSIHHQMLAINERIEILACCHEQISRKFHSAEMVIEVKENDPTPEVEIEAGMYYDTRCFFVQGHPEIGEAAYQSWTMFKFWEFLEALAESDNQETADKQVDEQAPFL